MQIGGRLNARLAGIELYCDDVEWGKRFYGDILGLELLDEEAGHYARFSAGKSFVCVERKGSESYPSQDKAVVFLEVPDLADAIRCVGQANIVVRESGDENRRQRWAVLHDPEGYNIILLEAPSPSPASPGAG